MSLTQTDEYIIAHVADLRFEFRAVGCAFSDKSFRGFAVSGGKTMWRPALADTVAVSVRKVSDIKRPGEFAAEFHAVSKPGEGGADVGMGNEWWLHKFLDGRECITVSFDGHPHLRAAQVVFSATQATLSIWPKEPAATKTRLGESTNAAPVSADSDALDPYIFPLFNVFLSRLLLCRGGFLIHASAVCAGARKGMIFTASSGTGKSTIAHIFQTAGDVIINDDMVAVRPSPDGKGFPKAYNIPMHFYRQKPMSGTIKCVCLLAQSPQNNISMARGALALTRVMANTLRQPLDAQSVAQLTQNIESAFNDVFIANLAFKPDGDVVAVVKTAIKEFYK